MAEVLKKFTFRSRTNSKYPWDEWLDGRTWRLVRGTDFTVERSALRTCAHHAAARRGARLMASYDGTDALVIQAVPNSKPDA